MLIGITFTTRSLNKHCTCSKQTKNHTLHFILPINQTDWLSIWENPYKNNPQFNQRSNLQPVNRASETEQEHTNHQSQSTHLQKLHPNKNLHTAPNLHFILAINQANWLLIRAKRDRSSIALRWKLIRGAVYHYQSNGEFVLITARPRDLW